MSVSVVHRSVTVMALAAGLFLTGCAEGMGSRRALPVPQPSKPVELSRYQGKWYEVGRYEAAFQRDCEAVTAEYAPRSEGYVSVVNKCRVGSVDGPAKSAEALARVVPDTGNTKLKVSFFWPFEGDYWILDRADDYSWAIIGEPTGSYLWILSRSAPVSDKAYRTLVARAVALGYDASMIRRTAHAAQ